MAGAGASRVWRGRGVAMAGLAGVAVWRWRAWGLAGASRVFDPLGAVS